MSYHQFISAMKRELEKYGWIYKYSVYDMVNYNYKIDVFKRSNLKVTDNRIDAYFYLKASYITECDFNELMNVIITELSKKELEAIK